MFPSQGHWNFDPKKQNKTKTRQIPVVTMEEVFYKIKRIRSIALERNQFRLAATCRRL